MCLWSLTKIMFRLKFILVNAQRLQTGSGMLTGAAAWEMLVLKHVASHVNIVADIGVPVN